LVEIDSGEISDVFSHILIQFLKQHKYRWQNYELQILINVVPCTQ